MKGLFITGSDTDVGKTIFSALLLARARQLYPELNYLKPVQCGPDRDALKISSLVDVKASELVFLKHPLSPHLAAHKENTSVDFLSLVDAAKKNMSAKFNVVEGAGGLLVPIDRRHFVIDLIQALRLPVILVARSKLGTINHTLLSLAALRAREIPVAAVIMLGPPNRDHEITIKHYGAIKKVYSLPWLSAINKKSVAQFSLEYQSIFDSLLRNQ